MYWRTNSNLDVAFKERRLQRTVARPALAIIFQLRLMSAHFC